MRCLFFEIMFIHENVFHSVAFKTNEMMMVPAFCQFEMLFPIAQDDPTNHSCPLQRHKVAIDGRLIRWPASRMAAQDDVRCCKWNRSLMQDTKNRAARRRLAQIAPSHFFDAGFKHGNIVAT